MMKMWEIKKEGFFFRAVNGNYKSGIFTSASQAGKFIEIKDGKIAHKEAFEKFSNYSD